MRRKQMSKEQFEVIIVGGGISGLATAFYLQKEMGAALRLTLVERDVRLGGKILTHHKGDFIMEGGPESFVTRKPEAWELCEELGMGDRLVGTTTAAKNYVLHNGRPAIVPTNPVSFISSPLLSARGKLRLLKEPFAAGPIDRGDEWVDESIGDFFRRRIGAEAVENLLAPAIGSVYLSDVHKMSVQVSMARFAEMEKQHGSLVRGFFALIKEKRAERKASGAPRLKRPAFATLRGGMTEMITTLAEAIAGDILTDTAVTGIIHDPRQAQPFTVTLSGGQERRADAVVLAIPTFAMADLLQENAPSVAAQLRSVEYTNVTTVNMAFNRGKVGDPFDGFGVVVPAGEKSRLLAVEGVGVKFPHRTPDDQFLLRAFVGGYRNVELAALPDDELIALVRAELQAIFGIRAAPTETAITRWEPANPQCEVGHLVMVTQAEKTLQARMPGLYLTGSGMRGLGIPDCIRQARETVAALQPFWQQSGIQLSAAPA
jgi:oxygen-dependent protoporphyrinogen oxidase